MKHCSLNCVKIIERGWNNEDFLKKIVGHAQLFWYEKKLINLLWVSSEVVKEELGN
jgi:hypothetical protein